MTVFKGNALHRLQLASKTGISKNQTMVKSCKQKKKKKKMKKIILKATMNNAIT